MAPPVFYWSVGTPGIQLVWRPPWYPTGVMHPWYPTSMAAPLVSDWCDAPLNSSWNLCQNINHPSTGAALQTSPEFIHLVFTEPAPSVAGGREIEPQKWLLPGGRDR
jgi:hypothetical protein